LHSPLHHPDLASSAFASFLHSKIMIVLRWLTSLVPPKQFTLPIKTAKRLEKNLDNSFILPFSDYFKQLRHMKCTSFKKFRPAHPPLLAP